MDQEPDVIRQDIDETRAALTDKIETLECQVKATVQGAKDTVEETIENVKEKVDDTICNVRNTVEDTVETVKRTFDLRYQTQQRPWVMLGGSFVAGFLAGNLIAGQRQRRTGYPPSPQYAVPDYPPASVYRPTPNGHAAEPAPPGLLSKVADQFGDEIQAVKGMAIAALVGLARDAAKQYLPQLGPQIEQVMNDVTRKFGAQPVQQNMMGESASACRH